MYMSRPNSNLIYRFSSTCPKQNGASCNLTFIDLMPIALNVVIN